MMMDNESLLTATKDYIEHAATMLSKAIQDKEQEHAFLPSSKKTKLSQIQFLSNTKTAFNKLSDLTKQNEDDNILNTGLNTLLLDLIQSVPLQPANKESWQEVYQVIDKLIRMFMAQLVAYNETLYNAYAPAWSALCQQHNLHIPYVQLNVIGLLNSISNKRADRAETYLKQLNTFNWKENFEAVFTKKSIRDRLYQIATLLIEQAGSIETLQSYLKQQFAHDEEMDIIIKIYEVYLNGIQRKLDLYRISYPEFTFDNIKHPIRNDVLLAKQRFQTIHGFITALVAPPH